MLRKQILLSLVSATSILFFLDSRNFPSPLLPTSFPGSLFFPRETLGTYLSCHDYCSSRELVWSAFFVVKKGSCLRLTGGEGVPIDYQLNQDLRKYWNIELSLVISSHRSPPLTPPYNSSTSTSFYSITPPSLSF